MTKYKVLVYDRYGKLMRDLTMGGPVVITSAVVIALQTIHLSPELSVRIEPVVQPLAKSAHA